MKLSELAEKILRMILLISFISIAIAAIYYRSAAFFPFMFGVFIGSAVSLFKVYLLDRAVDNALGMDKGRAGNYVGLQHILRLALSAGALMFGALISQINLWGVAAGILSFQLSLYIIKIRSKN